MKQKSLKTIIWQSCVALLLSMSMMLSLLCTVQAEETQTDGNCGDGVSWAFADGTITISGNGGMPASYEYDEAPWNEWNDEIIHVVVEKGVVAIADFAFEDCVNLQTVTLSATVEHIGWSSFLSCTSLQEFVVDEANNTFCAIDGNLIQRKTASFYRYAPGKTETAFEIPQGIVHINDSAFYKCENLEMVTIPTSVTSIGTLAFMHSKNLKKVSFSYSVELIDRLAFYACNSLQSVEFIGNAEIWAHIDVRADNENLLNAERTYIRPKRPGYEFAEVTVEVRDAETKELIPDTSLHIYQKVFGTIGETTFVNDCDGKTKHNIEFPIDDVYVYTSGLYEYTSFENVKKPANGKLVFYAQPSKANVDVEEGIELTGNPLMVVGETQRVSIRVSPTKVGGKRLVWSSNHPEVASVDFNGVVKAKETGATSIMVETSDGEFFASILIVVVKYYGDYTQFAYKIGNTSFTFGYEETYHIPPERYLQLGFNEKKAKSFHKKYKWGGNCFGLTMSSILFYKNIMQESRYPEKNVILNYPVEFSTPSFVEHYKTNKFTMMIELLQMSQLLKPKQPSFSAKKIAQQLDMGNPVKLGLKSSSVTHAVVIYDYQKEGDTYIFDIFDCSGFVEKLTYTSMWNYDFEYLNKKYKWKVNNYCTFDTLKDLYWEIYDNNSNNAATLLSENEENATTYIMFPVQDATIKNISGQTSTIVDGEISGEIENVNLILDSYLAENPKHTIIAPTDTYTITGTSDEEKTTTLADDNMSVEITHKSSVPVTISADLHEIKIENSEESSYAVKYTAYDNVFDEMTISGTTSGTVHVSLDGTNVNVSGADSITAIATVSDVETSGNVDAVNGNAVVNCAVIDGATNLQIFVDDIAATEKLQLAERQQTPMPEYSVAGGEYTEGQTLAFTKDDDTLIYYTTDGSVPTKDSGILYTMPIEINQSVTIIAIATKYGYTDSEILELTYTLPETAQPFASVSSGTYDTNQLVELFAEKDAEIYYTMDGTEPTETGIMYNTPITVYEDVTIKAYAKKNGVVSETVTYQYEINHRTPLFISNGAINQNGEMLKSDNMEELSKVTLVVNKTAEEDVTGTVIAAFYDGNKKLLNMFSLDCTLTENENVVELPVEAVAGAKNVKFFIWNKADSGKPICEQLEMN